MHVLVFYLFSSSSVIMFIALFLQLLWGFGILKEVKGDPPFNNPPGVDIWCGKAYRNTSSSFDPGGHLTPPQPSPAVPNATLIAIRLYTKYSYYVRGEKTGVFIVETPVQNLVGEAYVNKTYDPDGQNASQPVPFSEIVLTVRTQTDPPINIFSKRVPVNATSEVEFSLEGLPESKDGVVGLSVLGASPDAIQTYWTTATVPVLPERNGTGSMVRTDKKTGALYAKSSLTGGVWKTVVPYGFYTSWDWIASTINNSSATKNLTTYRQQGYNLIHPVPPGGQDPFDPAVFEEFLTICDSIGLYVMYDMRHTYQNTTSIALQLSRLQSHPSLLLYYTADEPDGWCDPLNATSIAYTAIQQIDKYHPVSLVLNCADFYWDAYTDGADIILEDTYPLILSSTYSPVYYTPCNATYGDCGCDNCHVGDPAFPAYVHNPFLDIVDRTEDMYKNQKLMWVWGKKPVWGVPQAFFDANSFWSRWPSAAESAVMALLRINHGAMGIVGWIYPTSPEIESVTSELATAISSDFVTEYVTSKPRIKIETWSSDLLLNAAAWREEMVGYWLIVVVNQGGKPAENATWRGGEVTWGMEVEAESVETLWGSGGWHLSSGAGVRLIKSELEGLDTSILKVKMRKALG